VCVALNSDLKANSITMSDEKRVELMEKFKNNELSENEVLDQVRMCVVCVWYSRYSVLCIRSECVYIAQCMHFHFSTKRLHLVPILFGGYSLIYS